LSDESERFSSFEFREDPRIKDSSVGNLLNNRKATVSDEELQTQTSETDAGEMNNNQVRIFHQFFCHFEGDFDF
jgi:hypothetical protein